MSEDFINHIIELKSANESFAIVTVIRRLEPSSGKVGDKAIVQINGKLTGWIGGGCVKSIVCKESVEAIQSGIARRVIIGKNEIESIHQKDLKIYKMTCQSEGTVEVFIEPQIPVQQLLIIGKSMIAKALCQLSKTMGYEVIVMAPDVDKDFFKHADHVFNTIDYNQYKFGQSVAVVIATQGESDEEALNKILNQQVSYVGFIASRKKREAVWKYLLDSGIVQEKLDTVFSPAGIDINAKKPEEVAISILAQIIQVKHGQSTPAQTKEQALAQFYINPVCGVPVDRNNPKHVVNYKNEKVYFCCDGCKIKFEKDPAKYFDPAYKYEPM